MTVDTAVITDTQVEHIFDFLLDKFHKHINSTIFNL